MEIHKFELAGLGKAPFRFIGVETREHRAGEQRHRESQGMTFTTNYCTSCDYCAQAIQNAFYLESADGRRFKVGCDCIKEHGDAGLKKVVNEQETRRQRERRQAKKERVWARQRELLRLFRGGELDFELSLRPSPARVSETALDYCRFCNGRPGFMGAAFYHQLERAARSLETSESC